MHALMLVAVLAVSGCATIAAGGPDRVPVWTDPAGADVLVDHVIVGQTPTMVTLDRHHTAVGIRIEMPGFAPIEIVRTRRYNGWFWVNLSMAGIGIFGFIVDILTSDVYAFDDSAIRVSLTQSTLSVRGYRPLGREPAPPSARRGPGIPGRVLRRCPPGTGLPPHDGVATPWCADASDRVPPRIPSRSE